MNDPFNLQRFVDAQAPIYDEVRRELGGGRKESHWMWFIFPQIAGLGTSPRAAKYAISSLEEVKAYLGHPMLSARLKECAELALVVEERTAREIFGTIDEMKFRSSMTLFARASPGPSVFKQCLDKYFDHRPDAATLAKL